MKKLFNILLILLLSLNSMYSQSFKAEKSVLFQENIGYPVLLMSDGTTIFLLNDEKERKMFVTIFNSNHDAIIKKKEIKFKKIKTMVGVFWREENGKARVYLDNNGKPFRGTIDPKTGNVEEEVQVINVSTMTGSDYRIQMKGWVVDKESFDIVTNNRIVITKEYKILNKTEAASKADFNDIAKINIKVYNSQDKEIANSDFDFMNHKYQTGRLISYYFNNNTFCFVSVLSKVSNKESYDMVARVGEEAVVSFTKYDVLTQKFTTKELYPLQKDFLIQNCKMKFSSDKKACYIAFFAQTGSENSMYTKTNLFQIFFQNINIESLEASKPFVMSGDKLNDFVKKECKMANGYEGGFMQDFFLDKNNNLVTVNVKNASFLNQKISTFNPEVFGFTFLDKNGNELSSNAYKYQCSDNKLLNNNFNFHYFQTGEGVYIVLNNLQDNYKVPLSEKIKTCKKPDETTTMIVKINQNGVEENYVFGEPSDPKTNMHCELYKDNFYFDEKSNTIIMTAYEGKGFEKSAATWIKLK